MRAAYRCPRTRQVVASQLPGSPVGVSGKARSSSSAHISVRLSVSTQVGAQWVRSASSKACVERVADGG